MGDGTGVRSDREGGRIPRRAVGPWAWVVGAGMVVVGFVVTALTAFDVRLFGEETVLIGAVAFAVLCAAAAGATIAAAAIEWLRPDMTPLPSWVRWWFALAGGGLTLLTVWGAWRLLVDSGLDVGPTIAIATGMVAAAVLAAWLTLLAASPDRLTRGGTERAVWFINAGVGLALGVLLAIAPVVAVSWFRTQRADVTLPDPPTVDAEVDRYVALGDSYSAGEGIPEYDDGTQDRDEGGNRCHRSAAAYSRQLEFSGGAPEPVFTACSGAVTAHLFGSGGAGIPPQVDPSSTPDPSVDLVTLTMGGNDVAFSTVVRRCFEVDDCTNQPFDPFDTYDDDLPLDRWALDEADALATRLAKAYTDLRAAYPEARIVVLGYPYLFPGGPAGVDFSDCDTVLRRVSTKERTRLRELQDELTARLYREATDAGVEFVSPTAVWDGHEPCGDRGQYTNALNPIVFDGSFHPNRAGQRSYATLLACYLNATEQPARGELVRLPWETGVTEDAPAPGTPARPVPCPEAAPDE